MTDKDKQVQDELMQRVRFNSEQAIAAIKSGNSKAAGLYACFAAYYAKYVEVTA